MKQILPYSIKHYQINNWENGKPLYFLNGDRYYCVFWWHSISLGHIYLEKNNYNDTQLRANIYNAIEPVIKSYIPDIKSVEILKQQFINNDIASFKSVIEPFFSVHLPINLPATVDISVVICTRERSSDLKLCLESLMSQTCVPNEIIVVDNAPIDDSTKNVSAQFKLVTYCREVRPGLDIARNTGAIKARFPIVAYTDDDVVLHPLWAYRVWETFLSNNIDAMTGLVIAFELETESQQIFEKHWCFNKGYLFKQFDIDFFNGSPRELNVWNIGAGANMAFKKVLLEKINYFDERLDVGAAGCSGDSEIWFRILMAGHTIKYNPNAIVYHKHRKTLASLHKQLFSYMRGNVAAALIQDSQNPIIGYKKYVYKDLPKYYFFLLVRGFPNYSFRYKTLWSEIKGIISGVKFYKNNKNVTSVVSNKDF